MKLLKPIDLPIFKTLNPLLNFVLGLQNLLSPPMKSPKRTKTILQLINNFFLVLLIGAVGDKIDLFGHILDIVMMGNNWRVFYFLPVDVVQEVLILKL